MTNADWWLRVRQQRDVVQPRQVTDVELWRLTKGAHIAAAAVRGVAGVGLELRLLYNGELRRSQVFRVARELETDARKKRRGWKSEAGSGGIGPTARCESDYLNEWDRIEAAACAEPPRSSGRISYFRISSRAYFVPTTYLSIVGHCWVADRFDTDAYEA